MALLYIESESRASRCTTSSIITLRRRSREDDDYDSVQAAAIEDEVLYPIVSHTSPPLMCWVVNRADVVGRREGWVRETRRMVSHDLAATRLPTIVESNSFFYLTWNRLDEPRAALVPWACAFVRQGKGLQ